MLESNGLGAFPGKEMAIPTAFRQSLNDDVKDDMDAVLAIMDLFVSIRPTMPAQYIRTFLLVAREEGLGVGEYAERAGVSRSVMTRHLLDIGERNRNKEEGFGLVIMKPDVLDLRKHRAFLSDEGKALAHQISRSRRRKGAR